VLGTLYVEDCNLGGYDGVTVKAIHIFVRIIAGILPLLFVGASGLLLPLYSSPAGQPTIVEDPLLDYYQANYAQIKNEDYPRSRNIVRVIACHLSTDKRSCFLITDGSKSGFRHGSDSEWTFYYPIKGSKYCKTLNEYTGDIPDYIGYVKEINAYGIISETEPRHASDIKTIWVEHIKDGDLVNNELASGTGDIESKYSKYLEAKQKITPHEYTLDELQKKYPKAVLNTGIVDDPLRHYVLMSGLVLDPHNKPTAKVYVLKGKFTNDDRESVFIANDCWKYKVDADKLSWQFYRPLNRDKYYCASELLTDPDQDHDYSDNIQAPIDGPAFIGYIEQIKGNGSISLDKTNNWILVQYASGNLIRVNIISDEEEKKKYTKYFDLPKAFTITSYNLDALRKKYRNP